MDAWDYQTVNAEMDREDARIASRDACRHHWMIDHIGFARCINCDWTRVFKVDPPMDFAPLTSYEPRPGWISHFDGSRHTVGGRMGL